MQKLIVLAIFLVSGLIATAQKDTTFEIVPLKETVVAATRGSLAKSAVAQQVKVLTQTEIAYANAQSSADLLSGTGQVFVQKSQQGGGSPVLRGFEASRVLLVVDGVRMNNAIYRAGHLQNVITMDNAALDRVEVLFGPASTVYGSDALGGAICFFTKNPVLAADGERMNVGGNASFRYGSVNQEKTGHADINLGGRKLGSLTSFTFSDFGDLRMGKNAGLDGYFGARNYYVERINGQDSLVRNSDPLVQKFTGFKQYDLLEKVVFRPNDNSSHTLNIQYSNSSNIPRYDRLTDPTSNGLASSEWYYGPQKRVMAAYTLGLKHVGAFDGLNVTASWQDIEESRHNRGFGASRRTDRVEQVKVYGLLAELVKNMEHQTLRIGLDGQYNDVTSTAQRVNVNTGEITSQSTRYPDGDNTMLNVSLYATHLWSPKSNANWTLSEGLRGGYSTLHSTFVSREFYPFPFDKIDQAGPTFSGNLGAVWSGQEDWRVAINASSGFRVPNVDDMTKVFDSQKGSVVVPNPDLKPEKTLNLDLNVTYNIADNVRWENILWVTALRDAIVTDVFQFNGQDSVEYDGVLSRVLASQNKREASLFGFSSNLEADVLEKLSLYGSIAYTKGRIHEASVDAPLDHIPPIYGKIGARWHISRASVDGFILFNGAKKLKDYNLEGEDNLQYAPVNGTPAWFTANLRGSYAINKMLTLQAGIDNVFDTQYRLFASGINAPGRNFWVTARLGF